MAQKQTTRPYEVRFFADPETPRYTVLGRYDNEHLASRCAGLIRACVTDAAEVEVVFNESAAEAS